MFSPSKLDCDIDSLRGCFKNEIETWFEEHQSSNRCNTKREELNLKNNYHRIVEKINEYETKCLSDCDIFKKSTIFFLNKNNCVSNYMLNRKHPFKLVIVKKEIFGIAEIQSLKQKK